MITYALLAFAIAAIGGLVLASHVLRAKLASWPLSLLHAALGATGLLLLIVVLLRLDLLQPLAPDGLSLLLDAGGFLALAAGGWLGGRLVYGHGIGSRSSADGSMHPRKGHRKTPAGT
jgi:uncharacterized membrane protein